MPAQCPNIQRCPSEQGLLTPTALNALLWLDGADPSTMTFVTTGVSEWRDKSGRGLHVTQATDSKQPKWNKLGFLQFASANVQNLLGSGAVVNGNTYSVIVLCKDDNTGTTISEPFSIGAAQTGTSLEVVCDYPANDDVLYYNSGQKAKFAAGQQATIPSVITVGLTSGVSQVRVNGVNGTDNGSGISTSDNVFAVGYSRPQNLYPWNGRIYGIVVIPYGPKSPQAAQAEGFLAWRHGLAHSLSESQPYRFSPPRNNRILTRKRRSLVLWAGASGVSTGNDSVTAQDVTLSLSCDSATIAQDHVVGAQDVSLAWSSDAATVAQDHITTAQDSSFALSSDQATIAQDHVFTILDVSFQLGSDAATLSQDNNDSVTPQDIDFAWTCESATLAQDHSLTLQDSLFSFGSDAATLAQDHSFIAQDVGFSFGSDAATLAQDHSFIAQDVMFQFISDTISIYSGAAEPAKMAERLFLYSQTRTTVLISQIRPIVLKETTCLL